MLASTLVIVPIRYDSVGEAVASLLCCAAGFLLAFFLEKAGSGLTPRLNPHLNVPEKDPRRLM